MIVFIPLYISVVVPYSFISEMLRINLSKAGLWLAMMGPVRNIELLSHPCFSGHVIESVFVHVMLSYTGVFVRAKNS